MAASKKRQIGDKGEGVACKYLENKGFSVIERNYWKPWGEIDIVAKKGSILSFVEVKSVSADLSRVTTFVGGSPSAVADRARRGTSAGLAGLSGLKPEENVHPAKIKRLSRAIQTYLLEKNVAETVEWRIDIACVFLDFSLKKARVEYWENVIL